jgi:hypothetical protein
MAQLWRLVGYLLKSCKGAPDERCVSLIHAAEPTHRKMRDGWGTRQVVARFGKEAGQRARLLTRKAGPSLRSG